MLFDLSPTYGGFDSDGINTERNYAPSGFDPPQQFTMSCTYPLPFGSGGRFVNRQDRVGKHLLGSWPVNGIRTYASGQPGVEWTAETSSRKEGSSSSGGQL